MNNGAYTRPHVEIVKDIPASIEYCKKDGCFVEHGTPPMTKREVGKMEQDKWKLIVNNAKSGKFEDIDYKTQFLHCKTLDYIYHRALRERKLTPLPELNNWWYHGTTGQGKSRTVREAYPDAYIKGCNKWWDGYRDQEVVIVEDFGAEHQVLGYFIKIWADHYPFPAEFKNGTFVIRPKMIIITSNYTPEMIWPETAETTLGPIRRRFKFKNFNGPLDKHFAAAPKMVTFNNPLVTHEAAKLIEEEDEEEVIYIPNPKNGEDSLDKYRPSQLKIEDDEETMVNMNVWDYSTGYYQVTKVKKMEKEKTE